MFHCQVSLPTATEFYFSDLCERTMNIEIRRFQRKMYQEILPSVSVYFVSLAALFFSGDTFDLNQFQWGIAGAPILWSFAALLVYVCIRLYRFNRMFRTVLTFNCLLCNFCCVTVGNCLLFLSLTRLVLQDFESPLSSPRPFRICNFCVMMTFGLFQ